MGLVRSWLLQICVEVGCEFERTELHGKPLVAAVFGVIIGENDKCQTFAGYSGSTIFSGCYSG